VVEAAGAKFKRYFIQCSACGVPAGIVEYENIGGQITSQNQFLNLLASDVRSGLADLQSRLADIDARLKRVGGLSMKQPVRAVVRDNRKGVAWAQRGCEVATADIADVAALTAAFTGTEGVFVLLPPSFDPEPGFPEVQAIVAAVRSALETARPAKVVCLSTIGAQATQPNLLTQLAIMEQTLGALPMPITFLR
jgi:uncharacterized protein YbjT (DUF2867 family)